MLDRNLDRITGEHFDLLVIGGGIFGAAALWEAQSRGLKAALIEKGDFCSGSSAKIYKMLHGGTRYLQHLDVSRMRSSSYERASMFRIAPHLNRSVPIVIPTAGLGMKSKPVLRAGMLVYDALTAGISSARHDETHNIPWASAVSRSELLDRFPGLAELEGRHDGGVMFHDGLVHNPARLVLAFIQSAVHAGACACNYLEATRFAIDGGKVTAVVARDAQNGDMLEVRAKTILNATGPWADWLINRSLGAQPQPMSHFSRDACFIVRRKFEHNFGLALSAKSRDSDAILSRKTRHLFLVPWRADATIVGTWHKHCEAHPEKLSLDDAELDEFVEEVNSGYPGLLSSKCEVQALNYGLIPYGEGATNNQAMTYSKRSVFVDHQESHGLDNLASLIGVRFTMGRGDAKLAVEHLARKARLPMAASSTHEQPLWGGDVDNMSNLMEEVRIALKGANQDLVEEVARNYGTRFKSLIELAGQRSELLEPFPGSLTLKVEVTNACKLEAAIGLLDIVLRRTSLGTAKAPNREAIEQVADIAQPLMGWSESTKQAQLAACYDHLGSAI